mmetsp:Transcript_382/g.758  ORF Transcript_382/g.758 Transcript_382/m.758 type:complete len:200 (+) Transcript_382:2801-3400(+)
MMVDTLIIIKSVQQWKQMRRSQNPVKKQALEYLHHLCSSCNHHWASICIRKTILVDQPNVPPKFQDGRFHCFLAGFVVCEDQQLFPYFSKAHRLQHHIVVPWIRLRVHGVNEGFCRASKNQRPKNCEASTYQFRSFWHIGTEFIIGGLFSNLANGAGTGIFPRRFLFRVLRLFVADHLGLVFCFFFVVVVVLFFIFSFR